MGTEYVTVGAGGGSYSGWTKVQWTASLKEAVRTFHLETTERSGEWAFPTGTPIRILATGDLVLDGYVNQYHSSGAEKTHNVSIKGRGKGQDFVDCSGKHQTGYAKDKTPHQFAQELDHYGIGINLKVPLPTVPMQQLMQGETCFRCVERHLRPHGVTMMGEADGSISITNASVAQRAAGALVEGVNIKEWTVTLSDQDRHSEYTTKGQNRHGKGADSLRIKESETDSGVRRYRNRIIVHETDTDRKRAKSRSKHERDRAAGNGTKATITVQGWRDDGGQLWTPNTIVFVEGPMLLHLQQDMLIERVEAEQDDHGGTIAKLHLVDPRAHKGKGQSGKGSDTAWNAGW